MNLPTITVVLVLAFALTITQMLVLRSESTQNGGGNEITERYFAKYYVKVLIDYLDSKIPGQGVFDNNKINKIYKRSKNTSTILPLVNQLVYDFPSIDIKSSKSLDSMHYFYQISNRLDIKQYYRDPIVSTFKPVLYIKTSGKDNNVVTKAGFLNMPQFKSVPGFDNCSTGYSADNKGNRIVYDKTQVQKTVKNRSKRIFLNTTSSCIDRSTGEDMELNEIDCIATGFSWDQPKYYEIDFTK